MRNENSFKQKRSIMLAHFPPRGWDQSLLSDANRNTFIHDHKKKTSLRAPQPKNIINKKTNGYEGSNFAKR